MGRDTATEEYAVRHFAVAVGARKEYLSGPVIVFDSQKKQGVVQIRS